MTIDRDPVLGKAIEQALPQSSPPYGAKQRVKRALDGRTRAAGAPWAAVVAAGCLAAIALVLVLVKGLGEHAPSADHGSVLSLDGVRVVLRTKTEVTVDRDGPSGTVLRLSAGTVFLKVRKGHPTAVLAGDTRVDVIGTLFGVARAPAGAVHVGVVEGVVRVTVAAAERTLHAGERFPADAEAPYPSASEVSILEEPAPSGSIDESKPPGRADSVAGARAPEASGPLPSSSGASSSISPASPTAEPLRADAGVERRRPRTRNESNAYLRARALEQSDDVRGALGAYASIANSRGANAEDALFAMTRLAAQHANPREALERAREYRGRFPEGRYARDVDVLVLNAELTLGDRVSADEEAERFLSRFANDPRAWRFHLAKAERALDARDCTTVLAELGAVPDSDQKRKIAAACR